MGNYFVHFTSQLKYEQIMSSGYLMPKNLLQENSTGGNVDMISAFEDFDYKDLDLISAFKKYFAIQKNSGPIPQKDFHENSIVGLLLDGSKTSIEWKKFPKQKIELFMPGCLDKKYEISIGIYVKTKSKIPVEAIVGTI